VFRFFPANSLSSPSFRPGLWVFAVVFFILPFSVTAVTIDFITPLRMLLFSAGVAVAGFFLTLGGQIQIPLK
jgi:hypothetical protein